MKSLFLQKYVVFCELSLFFCLVFVFPTIYEFAVIQ